MFLNYECRRLCEAYAKTKSSIIEQFKTILIAAVSILVLAIGLTRIQYIQQHLPEDALLQAIITAIPSGIISIVYVVFAFVYHWLLAPSQMHDALQSLLNGTQANIRRLEEERIPNITAEPNTGRRDFGVGPHLMWATLNVHNTSSTQTLHNVEVRIVDCWHVFETYFSANRYKLMREGLFDWVPITLKWSRPDTELIDIPGNSFRTVLVAFSDNSNGPDGAVFNDVPRTKLNLELKITVEISSPDAAVWSANYFIKCHPIYLGRTGREEAHFEFETWESWAATRNFE